MVWVLRDAADEHASQRRVPLARLHIEPKVRDNLHALGIETIGDVKRGDIGHTAEAYAEAHLVN